MPELPEVEIVARQLKPLLEDREILALRVFDKKLSHLSRSRLKSWHVEEVYRRGKLVIIALKKRSAKKYFAIHLRMSGRLIWSDSKSSGDEYLSFYMSGSKDAEKLTKHVRFVIEFKDGILSFVDTRRFGTAELSSREKDFFPIGVEPLSDEFTPRALEELIGRAKQPAKNFLLRQDKIVGLGNIYASEVLYLSRISPMRTIGSLSAKEIRLLHRSIVKVLTKAIEHCGTTFSDFQHTTGELGSFQNFLRVYGREGRNCRRCKTEILRTVQQQRSSFYCPSCQI